jgi:hypothetical protein
MRVALCLMLLALLATAHALSSEMPELKPGTRLGSVSMDFQHSWGDFYTGLGSDGWDHLEPDVRAGVFVARGLAVGGWLTMVDFFPEKGSIFTHTPLFAFGPMVGYFKVLPKLRLIPHAIASVGFSAGGMNWYSQRVGVLIGADYRVIRVLGIGIEGGWFFDAMHLPQTDRTWTAHTLFAGLRITGTARQ